MAWLLFFTVHAVTFSVVYYSILYNRNSNGLLKYFWGMKKEKQVCWCGFDAICVCPLIDHGQQPMKMHTEVALYIYICTQKLRTYIYIYIIIIVMDMCMYQAYNLRNICESLMGIKLQHNLWIDGGMF